MQWKTQCLQQNKQQSSYKPLKIDNYMYVKMSPEQFLDFLLWLLGHNNFLGHQPKNSFYELHKELKLAGCLH